MGSPPSASPLQCQLYNAGEPLSTGLFSEVKQSTPSFVDTLTAAF